MPGMILFIHKIMPGIEAYFGPLKIANYYWVGLLYFLFEAPS